MLSLPRKWGGKVPGRGEQPTPPPLREVFIGGGGEGGTRAKFHWPCLTAFARAIKSGGGALHRPITGPVREYREER